VNERLKVQSEQDPLTGLANRRHFQRLMAQAKTPVARSTCWTWTTSSASTTTSVMRAATRC
jgi:GGDEF domain-containing protein